MTLTRCTTAEKAPNPLKKLGEVEAKLKTINKFLEATDQVSKVIEFANKGYCQPNDVKHTLRQHLTARSRFPLLLGKPASYYLSGIGFPIIHVICPIGINSRHKPDTNLAQYIVDFFPS